MKNYNIISADYLPKDIGLLSEGEKNIHYEAAAEKLIPLVRDGTIWFPFHKHFVAAPEILFENLKTIKLEVKHEYFKLRSYYPKYGLYLPPTFRDKFTTIVGKTGDYISADVITDFFVEDIRLKTRRYDQEYSILDCWEIDSCLKPILVTALKSETITPPSLREAIYNTIQEAGTFQPSRAIALLKVVMGNNLAGKKWLDCSSGWSDRLIAAISLDMIYTGFDPNIALKPGHDEVIKRFGDKKKHRVIYRPFEEAEIKGGPYDVILTSPPFYNVEEYAKGQKGQSIVSYPEFNSWVVYFLFASLSKAWENLAEGGYLILHLSDTKKLSLCEMTNIFIENYLPGSSWEGVIGLSGESGFFRPVWVYQKLSRHANLKRWKSKKIENIKRTLYYTFPEIQMELLKFYANKYAPKYIEQRQEVDIIKKEISGIPDLMIWLTRKINNHEETIKFLSNNIANYDKVKKDIDDIRENMISNFPEIKRENILTLFSDDIMIACLLESLREDGTNKWCIAMVKLAL
jgi:hypothetical protein